jgi:two-component system sensor histidine kinase BaeS
LAILKGEIEAIQDGIRQATPQAIASLHSEVEHLNHLINDLYELSMSDIGALNYQKIKLNPLSILISTVKSFQPEFDQKGIYLDLKFDFKTSSGRLALVDGARLKQLFCNLLKNTLRYTDTLGKLVIEVGYNHNDIIMNFKDSSPGVSSNEMNSLFERLYRVESSRNRATGGAGLGLAICKNIVVAHDGVITAQASPYGGIWISVRLPLLNSKKNNKN